MAELKLCPLCNGTAEQEEWLSKCEDDSYLKYATIVCKCCGLTLFGCEHEEFEDIKEDEIKALCDFWNNRVESRTNDLLKEKQKEQNSYISEMLFGTPQKEG